MCDSVHCERNNIKSIRTERMGVLITSKLDVSARTDAQENYVDKASKIE